MLLYKSCGCDLWPGVGAGPDFDHDAAAAARVARRVHRGPGAAHLSCQRNFANSTEDSPPAAVDVDDDLLRGGEVGPHGQQGEAQQHAYHRNRGSDHFYCV